MIRTVRTDTDKIALRKKGWMLFSAVVALQLAFMAMGYLLQS